MADITDQCEFHEVKDGELVDEGGKSSKEILIDTLLEEIVELKKRVNELESRKN